MPDITRAIAALTYDEITDQSGNTPPLLNRSIANCLRDIETQLGAKGRTRLHAIAVAIDEALLALVEE